jgi:hypothetical protein
LRGGWKPEPRTPASAKCFSLSTLIFTVAGSLAAKQEHGSPESSSVLPPGSASLARFRTTAVLTTAVRLVGHRATRQRTASLPYPNSKRDPMALGGREAESEQKSDNVRVNYWARGGRAQFRTGGFRSVDHPDDSSGLSMPRSSLAL